MIHRIIKILLFLPIVMLIFLESVVFIIREVLRYIVNGNFDLRDSHLEEVTHNWIISKLYRWIYKGKQ